MAIKTITLAEFRQTIWDPLKDLPDDTQIMLGMGNLTFYRPKNRLYRPGTGVPQVVQLEINELYEVLPLD